MGIPSTVAAADVKAVRAFNRFYTQRIGVLKPYLDSDFTLTQVRVLYELAHRPDLTASSLVRELGLDPGYLSRILRRFEQEGWVERRASTIDARQQLLRLTPPGHDAFAPLQQKSRDEAAALLAAVPAGKRPDLMKSLQTVQQLLEVQASPVRQVMLRESRPGDIGWVVEQHGELYAREYGYSVEFEGLVAEIAGRFLRRFDASGDRAWIAELDGRRVGSVFLVRKSKTVAQLRLLILRPEARGLGLGARLTDAALDFARERGYRKVVLWTNGQLDAARAIYQARGFRRTSRETISAYGQRRLASETWELKL